MWAAGDCVVTHHRLLGTTYLPLGTTAHKQGRIAGENAIGGHRAFAGVLGTQEQLQAGCLQLGDAAVREGAPVADVAGDQVRDAADREVGILVGHYDADLGGRVEFAGAQRGGDARIAAADRYHMHEIWLCLRSGAELVEQVPPT